MLLEAGGEVRFQTRPVEGLERKVPRTQFGTYLKFRRQVLDAFRSYQFPVIQLHLSVRVT